MTLQINKSMTYNTLEIKGKGMNKIMSRCT